jgi:hypothetical protein
MPERFPLFCFPQNGGRRRSFMKMALAISCALILSVSNTLALDQSSPLPAGKPAGLRQAQFEDGNGMFVVAGAALVGITVALATANGDNGQIAGTTTPTTSSTSTTGTSP